MRDKAKNYSRKDMNQTHTEVKKQDNMLTAYYWER